MLHAPLELLSGPHSEIGVVVVVLIAPSLSNPVWYRCHCLPDGVTPVDLRSLARAVQGAGGFAAVEHSGLWPTLCASQLGVDLAAFPAAPGMARSLYVHLLLGLEHGTGAVAGVHSQDPRKELVVLSDDEDDPFRVD